MTEEHLHELEKKYEGALSALRREHPNISFDPLESQLDRIGTILSAYAVKMDAPDEPLIES